jgi:hypothetical protein
MFLLPDDPSRVFGSRRMAKGKPRVFTPQEDAMLAELVAEHPAGSWMDIAAVLPGRSARECRERWNEYLNPDLRVEPWTEDEDDLLLRQIEAFGHQWTLIAGAFSRRSSSDVKNRWHSHLRYCSAVGAAGRMELLKDANGIRVRGPSRRGRKTAVRTPVPLGALDDKGGREPRVWLPQLCSDKFGRLVIESLEAKQ